MSALPFDMSSSFSRAVPSFGLLNCKMDRILYLSQIMLWRYITITTGHLCGSWDDIRLKAMIWVKFHVILTHCTMHLCGCHLTSLNLISTSVKNNAHHFKDCASFKSIAEASQTTHTPKGHPLYSFRRLLPHRNVSLLLLGFPIFLPKHRILILCEMS